MCLRAATVVSLHAAADDRAVACRSVAALRSVNSVIDNVMADLAGALVAVVDHAAGIVLVDDAGHHARALVLEMLLVLMYNVDRTRNLLYRLDWLLHRLRNREVVGVHILDCLHDGVGDLLGLHDRAGDRTRLHDRAGNLMGLLNRVGELTRLHHRGGDLFGNLDRLCHLRRNHDGLSDLLRLHHRMGDLLGLIDCRRHLPRRMNRAGDLLGLIDRVGNLSCLLNRVCNLPGDLSGDRNLMRDNLMKCTLTTYHRKYNNLGKTVPR
jgi:hypothetical protein